MKAVKGLKTINNNANPPLLPKDDAHWQRLIAKDGVSVGEFEGKKILKVSKEALTKMAQQAFHDVEFMLRREHNEQVAKILTDPEASENDKYVALQFLRNAETAENAGKLHADDATANHTKALWQSCHCENVVAGHSKFGTWL